MTTTAGLTPKLIAALDARGIDPEVADRLGFGSRRGPGGIDLLAIPFIRNGEVVRRKYRSMGGEPEGKRIMFQDPGGERLLWNEDCLRDDTLLRDLDGQPVPLLITEGELDAAVAIQCGHNRTVSVPDGAPAPPDPEKPLDSTPVHERAKYAWFAAAKKLLDISRCPIIILGGDGDPPGAQLVEELSFLLGRARCKYLVYPKCSPEGLKRPERMKDGVQRTRCKDLNEVLEDWGQKGVQKTIADAPWLYGDGVFRMSDLPPIAEPVTFPNPMPGMGDHYNLRMGDWAVWTGIPSYGKTTMANDFYNRFADKYDLVIASASFEQQPQIDHRRNLRNWYYDGRPWTPSLMQEADDWIDHHYRFLVPNEDEDVNLDWLFEKLEIAVVQHGCRIILLDPWNELDHQRERDQTLTEYVGAAIKRMKRFTRKFGVHFVVIAHPAKQQRDKDTGLYREPTLYDISDCYHPDTEALTKRGWLTHDQITLEDEVMCFDPATGASSWERPSRVVRHAYSGPMHRVRGYGYDALVTPNHRMVVKPAWKAPKGTGGGRPVRWAREEWGFARVSELPSAPFVIPKAAIGALDGGDPDVLVIDGETYPAAPFMELAGWWVAEGSTASVGVTLCQAVGEKAEAIQALIDACGITATRAERPDQRGFQTMVTWYVGATHRGLVRWLREKGGMGAANKRVPYPVFSLSPRLKAAFLNGYIAGDGHQPKPDVARAVTTSKGLFDDLQRLAVELGIPTTGREVASKNPAHADRWEVDFGAPSRREASMRPHRNVTTESYSGEVWCLTVQTGAYFVRLNGRVMACGNSANWYNKADVGMVTHRTEDGATWRLAKSRYHDKIGKPACIKMVLNPETRRFETDGYAEGGAPL